MSNGKFVAVIKTIPGSGNTAAGNKNEMAVEGVLQHVVKTIVADQLFAFQIDEFTDVTDAAQLIMYVGYYNTVLGICDHVLGCKSVKQRMTGQELFTLLDTLVRGECGLHWDWCVIVSTDSSYRQGEWPPCSSLQNKTRHKEDSLPDPQTGTGV